MKKKLFIALAIVVGVLITGALVTASIWPVINVVETGKTSEYPDVMPQYYTSDVQRVFDESKASVETLERWTLEESELSTGVLKAQATSRMMGFVDDVTISIKPATEFVVQVDLKSASRVGKGDLGQNARNIARFYKELDRRLGSVRFKPTTTPKKPAEQGAKP